MYSIDVYQDGDTGLFFYCIYSDGIAISTSSAIYESRREALIDANEEIQEFDDL